MKCKILSILTGCVALLAAQSAVAFDLPNQVKEYLKTQHLMEDEGLPYCNADQTGIGDVFANYTLAHWSAMLDSLATIAPELRQQELIVRVIEWLPGRDYLKALNRLCDLNGKGIVKGEILEFAVHGKVPKHGFLSANYQDPQVIQLVQRLQSLLPKDSKTQAMLADILSGKQKGVDEDAAGEEGLVPPVKLPPQ